MNRIALVAGRGKLPLIFADEARRAGAQVIGIAINNLTDRTLESHVDKIYWGEITQPGKASGESKFYSDDRKDPQGRYLQ